MSACVITCTDNEIVEWTHWSDWLGKEAIAVFRFQWSDELIQPELLLGLLEPGEVLRASRYYRAEDARRFVYGKALVRILISQCTGEEPDQIRFTTGTTNKPALLHQPALTFNVAHSGHCIVVVIGRVSCGVDVEHTNPAFAFQDLIPVNFSSEEANFITTDSNARQRFYELWTRKEALVKATAKGISDDFCLVPSLVGWHTADSNVIGATGDWQVRSFWAAPDYPAAVAHQKIEEIPKFYSVDRGLFTHWES